MNIMDWIINILAFAFSLGLIVAIHELGHLLFAKKAGILCFEYSIGMGPLIYKKKGKETDFAIRAIPLGGYVSMAGEAMDVAYIKKDMTIGLNFFEGKISEIVLDKHIPHEKTMAVVDYELYGENEEPLFISGFVAGNIERISVLDNAKYIFAENKTQQIAPYHRCFESKKYLPKLLTLLAGPVMNFLLALLLFFVVASFSGKPQNSNVIGGVTDKNPAFVAGLNKGDKITSIGGIEITDWNTIGPAVSSLDSYEQVEVTYIKKGESTQRTILLDLRVDINQLGISNLNEDFVVETNEAGAKIGSVFGKTAAEDKLKKGDIITEIVYKDITYPITEWADITKITEHLDGDNARITYVRDDNVGYVYVTVWEKKVLSSQGASAFSASLGITPSYKYNFLYSITTPLKSVVQSFSSIVNVLGFLFGGSSQIGLSDLSGPVGIFNIVGAVAKDGFLSLLSFIAFLSVNIGIINLLPIPALDGGRILFISIEAATKKKIPRKVDVLINNAFFILLMVLFLYVTFNDVLRLL